MGKFTWKFLIYTQPDKNWRKASPRGLPLAHLHPGWRRGASYPHTRVAPGVIHVAFLRDAGEACLAPTSSIIFIIIYSLFIAPPPGCTRGYSQCCPPGNRRHIIHHIHYYLFIIHCLTSSAGRWPAVMHVASRRDATSSPHHNIHYYLFIIHCLTFIVYVHNS